MPTITKSIEDLAPNIPFDDNRSSTWFSYVKQVYSRQRGGTVLPPTKTQFKHAWNYHYQSTVFSCYGETLEGCKHSLSNNLFYYTITSHTETMRKAVAWTKMIMAFNMYAAIRREFGLNLQTHIDFIGSKNNIGNRFFKTYFRNRRILFISNNILERFIQLSNEDRTQTFWQLIFEIYDYGNFHRCLSFDVRDYENSRRNLSVETPIVETPVNNIEQEYFSRTDDDNTNISIDNQNIANMIMRTENDLPEDLKKMIYETCLALHISHPV
jgi:hypothetical protein